MLRVLRARDRDLVLTRRALRAAVVLPAVLALGYAVLDNSAFALFGAFGALAQILFVSFMGPARDRALYQVLLTLSGAVLVTVGTLVSDWIWAAALTMAAVAFLVEFAGSVSSVLANATNALLLAFILPITVPDPASSAPGRAAGWLTAGAAVLLANLLLWPAPASDPLRTQAINSCRLICRRLRVGVQFARGLEGTSVKDRDDAAADAEKSLAALVRTFYSTPYRPTALTTSARAAVRLVDELGWVAAVLDETPPDHGAHVGITQVCAVKEAAAEVLDQSADLLTGSGGSLDRLDEDLHRLKRALVRMEATATSTLSVEPPVDSDSSAKTAHVISSLEPSFRAQEIAFAISAIAQSARIAATADARTWWQRLLGRQPPGIVGPLKAAEKRVISRVDPHSVWLHNSIRAAAALTLAVVVARVSDVQHAFWVVLGTLSVLRSNALSTGQNAAAAVTGTVVGMVVGSGLIIVIGTDYRALWILLPISVCVAGLAPALIGFAAGQAGFTVAVLMLFDLLAPAGWRIGIVRLEDIAIGSIISLLVGLLFWPRGASAALRDALAEAYEDSADYLRSAVAEVTGEPTPRTAAAAASRASSASRRLDDAFRQLLTERGARRLPLADVTRLVTGVAGLRLAADATVSLWSGDRDPIMNWAEASRAQLITASSDVTGWYRNLAESLRTGSALPEPVGADRAANGRIVDAVRQDLHDDEGRTTPTAIRVIWTADHLDAARRLQQSVSAPARLAAATAGHVSSRVSHRRDVRRVGGSSPVQR